MKIVQSCSFNDVCACCGNTAKKFVSVPIQTIEESFQVMFCHFCLTEADSLGNEILNEELNNDHNV